MAKNFVKIITILEEELHNEWAFMNRSKLIELYRKFKKEKIKDRQLGLWRLDFLRQQEVL